MSRQNIGGSVARDSAARIDGASAVADPALFAAIVASSADAITSETLAGIVTSWNPAAECLLGFAAAEVIGKASPLALDRRAGQEGIMARLQGGESQVTVELCASHKNGSNIRLTLMVSALRDEDGTLVGLTKVCRNGAGRKDAEERLAKASRLLDEAAKLGKIGGWEFDIDTGVQTWTDETYAIHELDPGYQLKLPEALNFYPPASRPIIEVAVNRAIIFGEAYDLELQFITAKGNHRWVRATGRADPSCRRIYGAFQDITERKAIEKELRGAKERYEHLAATVPVVLFDYLMLEENKTHFLYMNNRSAEFYGVEAEEAMRDARSIWSLIHPDDFRSMLERSAASLKSGESFAAEYGITTRAGEKKWFYSEARPQLNSPADSRRGSGFVMDITERKKAENALRAANEFNKQVINGVREGIIVLDRDLCYLVWNPFMEQITGIKSEEVLGRHLFAVLPWLDQEGVRAEYQRALRGEPTGPVVLPFNMLATGRSGWVSNDRAPLFNEDGEIVGIIATMSDVSQLKQTELELRETESRFRNLFENSGSVMMLIDPGSGRIKHCNHAAVQYYGYPMAQMVGMPMDDINAMPPAETMRIRSQVINGEENYFNVRQRLASGEVREVESYATRLDIAGMPHVLSVIHDITERKMTEKALLDAKAAADRASAAKSRFLAAASHDLRQPMQAIELFLFSLQKTALDEKQRRLTRNIGRSSRALGELLNSLLEISRLDAGAVNPRFGEVELFDLFRQLDDEFSTLALEKGLRFKFWFPSLPIALYSEAVLLRQILRNLVGNAIRYTERGGVLLGARVRHDCLLLQVWDTGIGIAANDLARIWDEFLQVRNLERDRTQGLGLGLSIVKRIADLLGYRLTCRSRLGCGSVFEVAIPLKPTAARAATEDGPLETELESAHETAPAASDSVDGGTGKFFAGATVVLVEDDELVAESMELWLAGLGFKVLRFADGDQALAHREVAAADLYITDYRLPGEKSGLAFLQTVQESAASVIRAIIITGDTTSEELAALTASDWRVLSKPVQPSALAAVIMQLIEN